MNGVFSAFGTWLLALLPAMLAVYAGCVLFVLLCTDDVTAHALMTWLIGH